MVTITEIGKRLPGVDYQDRPGSYALIFAQPGHVVVVDTPSGRYLPGGGADEGETEIQTLEREVAEECGFICTSAIFVTKATQYVHAPGEGYIAKRCSFFQVDIAESTTPPIEDDHKVRSVPVSEALESLRHESQQYALRLACEKLHARHSNGACALRGLR